MTSTDRAGDRWTKAPSFALADVCAGGPVYAIFQLSAGDSKEYLLHGAERLGAERVGGRKAVHFRVQGAGVPQSKPVDFASS